MQKTQHIVVIGAGPAGLCAGWNMVENGHRVVVLERDSQPGGLAKTVADHGYRLDLGVHNIHTDYRSVQRFLQQILAQDYIEHYPRVKILYRNRLVDYPLKGIRAFLALPPMVMPAAALSFLAARTMMFLRNPTRDASFEDWIKNRFGSVLYRQYFAPYAEKAWKIAPSDLSRYVGEKRVPVLSIEDYIRGLFRAPPKQAHDEDWTSVRHFYPRYGIGQICDALADKIRAQQGELRTDSAVTAIHGDDRRITAIEYDTPDGPQREPVDFLFSSMPLPDLIKAMRLPVPDHVREAAAGLDYCAMTLLYLEVARPKVFETPIVYFSDPAVAFNRVYDVGQFSRDCVPEGKTALCFEFTCNVGDATWTRSAEQLSENALAVLQHHGMLDPADVEGVSVHRITHGYPRFRIGFETRIRAVLDYLSGLENVLTLGRQGLFCYANVDDALHMGFRSAEMIHTINRVGVDYSSLFPKHVMM